MPLKNPDFQEPGPGPGEAAAWTLTAVTRTTQIAGFGSAPEEAWEDFEGWFPLGRPFDDTPHALGFFDSGSQGFEDFEGGWGNTQYLWELPPAQLLDGEFGGSAIESFEDAWATLPYYRDWDRTPSWVAFFDTDTTESFDDHWRDNQSYARDWQSLASSAALFGGPTAGTESFEGAWTRARTL